MHQTTRPPAALSTTQAQSQVTFPDDVTQARSAYTTDVDTTVSDLKTVFTESMAAQSKMLQTFMQTSQQQQQQLMEATQTQQANTNQLLQHLSSIMASLVPGAISSAQSGSHPPLQSSETSSDTDMQTVPNLSSLAIKSPNKRPAPADSPSGRQTTQPDITMHHAQTNQNPDQADPNAAAPMLDPDPNRTS